MTFGSKAVALASLAAALSGCASVPRDAGFADVQREVMTERAMKGRAFCLAVAATRRLSHEEDAAWAPRLNEGKRNF